VKVVKDGLKQRKRAVKARLIWARGDLLHVDMKKVGWIPDAATGAPTPPRTGANTATRTNV
jgi:hypothetical protein